MWLLINPSLLSAAVVAEGELLGLPRRVLAAFLVPPARRSGRQRQLTRFRVADPGPSGGAA